MNKEVPSSPKLSTLFSLHLISPLPIYIHKHTHAHTHMPGAILFLLTEVIQKSFFCLASSSPFIPPLGRVVAIGLFCVCVSVCVCALYARVCFLVISYFATACPQ